MRNSEKNNQKKPSSPPQPERFQPKVLFIWLAIFAIIISLWSFFPGEVEGPSKWNISKVIEYTQNGLVVQGTMESDPSGGNEWYAVRGKAKNPLAGKPVVQAPKAATGSVSTTASQEPEVHPDVVYFKAEGRLTADDFRILQSSGVFVEKRASTLFMELVFSLLPFLIIIGLLYFLFVRQLRQAGKGAMSFGKSKAKKLTPDREQATFKDVAGCDEAKEEVSEVVDFLRNPKKFQKIGGKIPKGVLMMGPPGTGKTLLARAVAGEADVPFYSISGSDFVEMFVGVGAARVRDMFEQGRKNAPCLIFIDEIDAVGRQRGAGLGGGNDEREQTLNSLLVEMDGFDGHEGVIIIAATNRPDVLDNALLRPGRFDRQITIDLPDVNGREEILNVHAKKIRIDDDIDLSVVARNTPGFSGADLANLLNEGALIAARYNKDKVQMVDFEEARDKIAYGRERRRLMDEEDRKITAYHEAGHALVQAVVDDDYLPVHKVTIIPRGQSLGSTMFSPKKDILNHSKRRLLNQICCAMGGRVAEELVFGDITSGAGGDIKSATKMARHMVCDWGMTDLGPVALGENQDHVFLGKEISRSQNYSENTAQKIDSTIHEIIEEEHCRARDIITEKRAILDVLAEALLEFETIEGKHVYEALEHGEIRSSITKYVPPPKKEEPKEEKSSESDASSEEVKDEDLAEKVETVLAEAKADEAAASESKETAKSSD